jgi:hypothetical protein
VTARIDRSKLLPALFVASCVAGCAHAPYPGATITVVNTSEEIICDLYLSRVSGEWGEDELEESERLEIYKARSFDVAPGTWHVRADNCRGGMVYTRHGFQVRDHVLLQLRPVNASIDRKRWHWIAPGVRRFHDM